MLSLEEAPMLNLSSPSKRARGGFSLIEMLLVVAIIGILGAIAIPSYMGQRRRARVIGDAISNAKVLQMALETRKADNGTYGADGTYGWKKDGSDASGPALLPTFQPKGNSMMNFQVVVANGGVSYILTVFDPTYSATTVAYQTDQTGAELKRLY
jgi:prepilin-type N-terminal cleavage/methylation domain-containing protein